MEPVNRGGCCGPSWNDVKETSREGWMLVKSAVAKIFCCAYSPYNPDEEFHADFIQTYRDHLAQATKDEADSFLVWRLQRGLYIEDGENESRLIPNPEARFTKEMTRVVHWIYNKERRNWAVVMERDEETDQMEAYLKVFVTPRMRMEKFGSCCGSCNNFKVDSE